ncbi:GNAT family N-acetyltransferase [Acetivibrio sp. MSJd-27]|uniref:GNAT family N-acetyltransferase n=1 Tax=Acetivibrio sp. MSJd-27 TaxID=2841523 RepID=UPI001C11F77E|nr:GNAT family N-acetyltransferase [Acetivibrio sp. MSJd-27]MBU5450212.1 GNAT family N-acetyltransferase [Acetivibrio sp. MSJd-27]
MENFQIRAAEKKDSQLVLDFIKGIAAYEKMSDCVTATKELLEEFVFDRKAASVFIAEWEGKPIGFALFFENFSTFVGRTGLYLEDLFVLPEARGKGIGKKLFQAVAQEAVNRGCQRMEWTCLDWNQPSIEFYLRMGAVPMSEWTNYRLSGDAIAEAVKK